MKRIVLLLLCLGCLLTTACGGSGTAPAATAAPTETPAPTPEETAAPAPEGLLPDGVYRVSVDTDSSMFHINEAHEGKGVLTVENGAATLHITLGGKGIVYLYPGSARDAAAEGAEVLEPTEDTVTYKDGSTEIAYGFDIPVPVLDEEFPCAICGTKGKWYDHTVIVTDPEPLE